MELTLDVLEQEVSTPRGIALLRMKLIQQQQQDHNDHHLYPGGGGGGFATLFVPKLQLAFIAFQQVLTQLRNTTTTNDNKDQNHVLRRRSETLELKRLLHIHWKIVQLDPILAEEIGREGSHQIILQILKLDLLPEGNEEEDEDTIVVDNYDALIELQDLAGQVAAACNSNSNTGGTFPLPMAPYDRDTIQSRLPLYFSTTTVAMTGEETSLVIDKNNNNNNNDEDGENETTYSSNKTSNDNTNEKPKPSPSRTNHHHHHHGGGILIHQVTERQSEQRDVGFLMWPSAVVLSQWLLQNPTIIQGKSVLELGSGCGLTGLVCARLQQEFRRRKNELEKVSNIQKDETKNDYNNYQQAQSLSPSSSSSCNGMKTYPPPIILTDFNPQVLKNLERNIILNDLVDEASVMGMDFYEQSGTSTTTTSSSSSISSSWKDRNGKPQNPVEVVLGADIICKPEDATFVAKSIHDCLVPGGEAILISASSKHRFGVDHLSQECFNSNLIVQSIEPVDYRTLLGGVFHDDDGIGGGGGGGGGLEDMKKTTGFVEEMDLILFRISKKQEKKEP